MSLRKDAEPGRAVLLRQALEEAEKRTPEDLKKFVRRLVQDANRRGRNRGDKPGSDFNARNMHFGKPDSAGMCRITITAPAGEASMIKAAMDAGRGGIGDAGQFGSGERDTRTMGQRQFDHLMNIVRGWSAKKSSHQNGVGSVVVALTLEDLMGADYNTRFMTNTGIEVSCYDLLRMGFTGTDFLAQLDSVTGVPLSLGKTRLATVYQRIALLAMQGVCAWHGCDKPMSELDIHHIIPFLDGGPTDIDNLIGLCRQHHMCNNDRRDGAGNKGYVDRDPDTGRVGVVPADGGPMRFNETVGAHDSPGHKIRVRHEKQRGPDQGRTSGGPSHSSDPALFPVPT